MAYGAPGIAARAQRPVVDVGVSRKASACCLRRTDMEEIKKMFSGLDADARVAILVDLYYMLDDYHKDEFLRQTENG